MDRAEFLDVLLQQDEQLYIQWQEALQTLITIQQRQRWIESVSSGIIDTRRPILHFLYHILQVQFLQARAQFHQIHQSRDDYSRAISTLRSSAPYYHLHYFQPEDFAVYYTDIIDDDGIEDLTDEDF